MYINTFKYTPKDVSCQLCTEYVKKLGCTALRCPWLAERIEASVVGYREVVMETFPRDRRLSPRLNLLIEHYPGSLWSNEQHERRMQYQCAVQGYRRRRDTNAYYAAMYLLTSNDDIYRRTANCFCKDGIEFGYAKFVSAAKEGADCFIDWMRGSLFGQVAGMVIFPSTLLGILPVGCLLYMHGTLSAETFLAVIVLSFGVMQPLITAFSYTDDIVQVKTIVGEVAEVLSGEDMQRPTTAEKLPADNSIELKDVRFAYHDKEVLHGINLHIAPGTVNALVGPSGSGKSTITRLIASLWDVKDGAIELGGVDIRTLPLAECTKRIAYVSQDNYLFDLSVIDNIRMGRKGATDAEVIDAAKKCGCHEFIMGLENGYQTVCGASGGHLSGGERQRISIARAMLKDAPIVILDEATSYTDPENEAVIQSALARLVRGKTLLVIAHRLSTIADADQIIVVNQGRIEATGTQTELLASCPLYQNMWEAHISVKDDGEVA